MIIKIQNYIWNLLDNAVASFLLLLSIFISLLPIQACNYTLLSPLIPYIVIFYWIINEPSKLNFFVIISLGFLKDSYEGFSGANIILYLMFTLICKSLRKFIFNHSYFIALLGFSLSLLIIQITKFFLYGQFISILMFQWIITCLAYIPIHFLVSKLRITNE